MDLQLFLKNKLDSLKEQSKLRSLPVLKKNTDFTSNDYLGLARSVELRNMIRNIAAVDLSRNGSTGSRLLSGNSEHAEKLEHRLSALFDSEATLLFNSGYSANLAVLSTLPQKGDTIVHDEHAHASLKDGARLSHATKWSFKHNDLNDLEKKLKSAAGNRWVVVESIYSMNGDRCPLTEVAQLADRCQAHIILDEAHSTGVFGKNGNGLANSMGIQKHFPVRVYTFGKAMGVHGACVAGSRKLIDYLINFSRPFIYTTALPDHALISIGASFDFLEKNLHLQNSLLHITQEFIKLRTQMKLPFVASESQIQAIVVPGNEQVKRIARFLQEADFDVRPILSPTVRAGSERLRICLHAFNQKEEIESFTQTLGKFEMQE